MNPTWLHHVPTDQATSHTPTKRNRKIKTWDCGRVGGRVRKTSNVAQRQRRFAYVNIYIDSVIAAEDPTHMNLTRGSLLESLRLLQDRYDFREQRDGCCVSPCARIHMGASRLSPSIRPRYGVPTAPRSTLSGLGCLPTFITQIGNAGRRSSEPENPILCENNCYGVKFYQERT